jgi:hypothetical protein
MTWVGHVAGKGLNTNVHRVLVGKSESKNRLEDLRINGNISK